MFLLHDKPEEEGDIAQGKFWSSLEHNQHKSDSDDSSEMSYGNIDKELLDSYREQIAASSSEDESDADEQSHENVEAPPKPAECDP
jgi:hypothetical protein